MSNITVFYGSNFGFFAEDSAGTFDIEGQRIRYSDECEKVFTVGEIVVGMVGNRSFYSEIKKEFCENSNKSPQALQEIARRLSCKYPILESGAGANGETIGLADILMGMMEDGHFVLYQLDSRDNFNIVERRAKPPACAFATTGYKTKEAGEILTRLFYGRDLRDGKNVIKGLKELFEQLACTEIGGTLRISLVNSMGAHIIHQSPIKNPSGVEYFNPVKHSDLPVRNISMVYANTIIASDLYALSSGDGFTKIAESGLEVWDNSDPPVKRVHIGQYEPGKFAALLRDGEIYGSLFKTGTPGATSKYVEISKDASGNGYLEVIGASGHKTVRMDATQNTGRLGLYDNEGNESAYLFVSGGTEKELLIRSIFNGLHISDGANRIIVGQTSGDSSDGIGLTFLKGDLSPLTTNTGNVGTNANKWARGRAVVWQGDDIAFEERTCVICGQGFASGDPLILLTKAIDPMLGTCCVPVHMKCADKPATFKLPHWKTTTKYKLNDQFELEPYLDFEYAEEEVKILRLHPNFEYDQDKNEFYRKDNEENRELFGDIVASKRIKSSRRAALCSDITVRKKLQVYDYEVNINGGAPSQ